MGKCCLFPVIPYPCPQTDFMMKGVRNGFFHQQPSLAEEHFKKVYDGLFKSCRTSKKFKNFLQQAHGLE